MLNLKLKQMYINNENFEKWMATLSKNSLKSGKLRQYIWSKWNLYDLIHRIPELYNVIGQKGNYPTSPSDGKTYYRASDIRAFVREFADSQTYKQFEKANQLADEP